MLFFVFVLWKAVVGVTVLIVLLLGVFMGVCLSLGVLVFDLAFINVYLELVFVIYDAFGLCCVPFVVFVSFFLFVADVVVFVGELCLLYRLILL